MASLKVVMIVESDRLFGDSVQHVLPSHEDHDAVTGCSCIPTLLVHAVIDRGAIKTVKLYWHRWKQERMAKEADDGI